MMVPMTHQLPKLFLLCAALSLATPAHLWAAKVYKWTDASGQVHFSQFPPSDVSESRETVNVQTTQGNTNSGAQELNALRDKLKQDIDARNQRKEEAEQQKQQNAMDAENCERAQQRLALLQQGGRFYGMDAKGEREYYDAARTAAETKLAKEAVATYCK